MLCHLHDETLLYLLTQCRYAVRVWDKIFEWMAEHIPPRWDWSTFSAGSQWWTQIGSMSGAPLKGLRSLIILMSREIWKDHNARVFQRKFKSLDQLLGKIKEEARCWILAGARHLGSICIWRSDCFSFLFSPSPLYISIIPFFLVLWLRPCVSSLLINTSPAISAGYTVSKKIRSNAVG